MKRLLFIWIVCGVATLPVSADLVQNGSFENGTLVPTYSGYEFAGLPAGSTAIDDWLVIGSGVRVVDYIGSYWQASDGTRSVDLDGYQSGNGGIQQMISTIPSRQYRVAFDLAGNPDGGPPVKTMRLSAIGGSTQTQDFTFDASGSSRTDMGWTSKQWSFVADASSTILRFESITDGTSYGYGYGPVLDNVSVVPVPGALLLGVLGLGATGLRLRR
jgi:choice-of-anchor C domain-containing protein